jgi:hypothetical protein
VQYVILVFPHERPIFLRETGNNMYSVGPYYLGRFLAEFPAGLIVPVIFGTIIYFAVGLNQTLWWKFPLFCNTLITLIRVVAIMFLIFNAAGSASLIMSAAFKQKETAVTIAPLFILVS